MYLKRLELQGFKSFADKTILEFMPGITSVIGPNGSGKSNISDAIRWVLGEQSIKSLRGAKSEDIIFAGTESRKSLGFAESSIVIDNSDGKLPIEYTEVTITRRVYRTGETGYYINKTACRLKDILELLMDTGIGKDGYSIIGQGKIDEILSNKSEERRHIFEEAAGIVKYRARKGESEKKLEQTKLNLVRINDILSEIEGNIEPLKNQSEKAKKFLNLREELKSIEVGLHLENIDKFKKNIEAIKVDEDVFVVQEKDEEAKLEKMQELKEKLKIEIDELIVEIEKIQGLSFESSNSQEKLNSEINLANEKISNNNENSKRLDVEIEELKQKNVELEEEKTNKLDKKTNLFSNKEKFEKELEEKLAELQKLNETLSGQELEIEAKKQKLQNNINQKFELNYSVDLADANSQNLDKRENQVKNEISATISELDSTRITKEEIAKVFSDIENNRNTISKKLGSINNSRQESILKIKEYEENINKMSSELRIKDSRHKFLVETEREKEGYTRSVKSLLLDCEKNSNLNAGVHGVLASLISVPREYETAIEMCMGQSLQNIVTNTEQDAKRLVEYLRKNNLGRASFLPISSVKGQKINFKSKNPGVIGIASDLVSYDKKYDGIVLNLLGRTVIVDNMDTAVAVSKENKYSFRIVTVLGDIINSSGQITGGSVANKTANILGRNREIEDLEKQVKDLQKQIASKEKEKEEYESSIENVLEEVMGLEQELKDIDIVYATEKQKLVAIEENVAKLESKLQKLREEIDVIQKEKENIVLDKETSQNNIADIEKEALELQSEIEEFSNTNKEHQKYIDDLNSDITDLKISVSSFDESEISINELVERIETEIANNISNIENKNTNIAKVLEENTSLENNILDFNKKIEEIKEQVKSGGSKVDELKNLRIEKSKELEKTDEEILNQFKLIEDLKEQISKIEVKKSKVEFNLEQIYNKLWEDYELTPNNAEEFVRPKNIAEAEKQVNKIKNQIKELGSINIEAIEEYKKTKERYDFLCEQRLDLENSVSKLKKVIQDITSIMKEQFKKQFDLINKNFGQVFSELFGGGKAEVKISDEENILESGIEIEVQPPGKKLQNMMLLSRRRKSINCNCIIIFNIKTKSCTSMCIR